MATPSFLEQAADFLRDVRCAPGDPAVAAARDAFVDYFGVALAGSREPVARNVSAWASERSFGAGASVIGGATRLDPENAALCNAVAGHALDFDDTSWATIGHPTTVVAPAAIAVAESINATGLEALTAYLAGVEVSHRLAELAMPQASENGWHTTGALYAVGAAAAACVLLRLERPVAISAMGLAASRSSGIRSNFGTQTKPYHAGMAAKAGLEAVSLAQAGVTASPTAIEGQDGFLQCFGGPVAFGRARPDPIAFGRPFDLEQRGLAYKRYPCCSGSHPACDLLLDLMREYGLTAGEVIEVRAGLSLLAERELVCHAPKTPVEARFSLEFALATILTRGRLELADFSHDTLSDPDIQRLMASVRMSLDPDLARLGFIGTAPVKLAIVMQDGRTISGERDLAVGNPERPMSAEDRRAKFHSCASRVMDASTAVNVFEKVTAFDAAVSVSGFMADIALAYDPG